MAAGSGGSCSALADSMSAIAIIGFLALLGFGIWLLYGARDLIRLGLSSYKWVSTEGTNDPERPEMAVLRRGLQFGAVFGIVPIGAAILWLFLSLRQ